MDRLRYQALMVFKHLDSDKDGKLSVEQAQAYMAQYCADRFKASNAGLQALYDTTLAGLPADAAVGERYMGQEQFVDLMRAQVAALKKDRSFPKQTMNEAELGKLAFKTGLPPAELAGCLAVFRLLDNNNDGYLALTELQATVLGLEKDIFEDVLEDADANADGFLTFEDFLSSYAQEKPVLLNMIVLAVHSAIFWVILNSPLDQITKMLACAFLLFKPQIVTSNVIKVYHMFKNISDRARAEIEVAGQRHK